MRPRSRHDLAYGLLVALIVAQGGWWVIYQSREGRRYEEAELRRLEAERRHARNVLATLRDAPAIDELLASFPELELRESRDGSKDVAIAPRVVRAIHDEGTRRRRMFLLESAFFLALLGGGTLVLALAHRAENRLRRSREILLAGITHEFRTPLASLRLWAETLQRDDVPEESRRRIRGRLLEDASRLEDLVGQVLAAGRGAAMDPRLFEPLDLGHEASEVLREMEGYLQSQRAHVAADLPEGHEFLGNHEPFAIAFRNLVQNAAQYSPQAARIHVQLDRDGRWLRLSVRDEGPGIARRHHRRIFESFTRLDDVPVDSSASATSTRGAGLGLFLARRNAEAMGGRVELSSSPGHGSTFTLVLPARAKRGDA